MALFFVELSIVVVLAFVVSFFMHKIKQPLLVGYILTGVLAGPLFFNILSSSEGYQTFSHIGVALLLFIVGLHLNLKLVKEVGMISLITGVGQVLFTSIIGFSIAYLWGFGFVASVLIAISLTFSSTIIIVKLLTDKKDIETLYGKISMGFLIVQDLIAVVLLMIVSGFLSPTETVNLNFLLIRTLILTIVAVIFTYILSAFILPKVLDSISKSSELMYVFIIAWCLGISALFTQSGFSLEVGALLAGVALASSPYQFEISARVKPLRDFFIIMFFILLGSQMVPTVEGLTGDVGFAERLSLIGETLGPIILPAIIFSFFVLIGNPIIVLVLMLALGYSSRTGFLAGLTVAQISEFSLILAMLGRDAGFLSSDEVSLITMVGIITITCSTYMILNGNKLYKIFEKPLRKFEAKKVKDKSEIHKENEILIFGYDRIGYSLLKTIEKMKKNYLVIDHDPDVIRRLKSRDINCIYGDASNIEFISEFNLDKVKLFVSTIPDFEISLLLLENLRNRNKNAVVFLTVNNIDNALELYKQGADYVILPHFLGGDYVSTLIETTNTKGDFKDLLEEKIRHINELKERKGMGLEHPVYEK